MHFSVTRHTRFEPSSSKRVAAVLLVWMLSLEYIAHLHESHRDPNGFVVLWPPSPLAWFWASFVALSVSSRSLVPCPMSKNWAVAAVFHAPWHQRCRPILVLSKKGPQKIFTDSSVTSAHLVWARHLRKKIVICRSLVRFRPQTENSNPCGFEITVF